MKKFLAFSLLSSSIFLSANSVKADWDFYGIKLIDASSGYKIYTIDSSDASATEKISFCGKWWSTDESKNYCNGPITDITVDNSTGKLLWTEKNRKENGVALQSKKYSYDPTTNTISDTGESVTNWKSTYDYEIELPKITGTSQGDIKLEFKGKKLLEKKSNGEVHIGENSWITKEENGRQKVWAKDANGNSIPIDYTNGTKLLINGRDVEQSINNVGALSAALTGLPTVPTDTTLACGLGTGTHGGDFAFSGGCASKVNDKLSINYAASMTMPGQDYAGDFEDTFSARAGFVWKLGKSTKPTLISLKAKEKMENKINSLEEKNEKILSKNQKLENKVSTLLARLERLEKVALNESQSKDLATIKLP